MQIISKDILTVESGIICQQVNAEGWMGAGLALQIRRKWPIVYRDYSKHPPKLGEVQGILVDGYAPLWVFNLCAQRTVGRGLQTEYKYLIECLDKVRADGWNDEGEEPVYLPWKISCGLAGGDWDVVIRILLEHLPEAILCVKP